MKKPILFSGIQPTGNLHLGNYLGAVKNWVELQNSQKYDCYFCIVDLHSLTGGMTAEARKKQIFETASELLALGVDPKKSTFFVQSQVQEHTELAWVFNTVTPIAELERMTQFKDKSSRQEKNINTGLLTYPTLMAADILLYKTLAVPVGQDQIQHIELTRDIARFFNNRYGNYFPETKYLLTEVPKVMSLLEPSKKMSKSLGAGHVIELQDSPEIIVQKLKKAVTATSGGEEALGASNLLLLLKHFGSEDIFDMYQKAEKDGTIRYGDLKRDLGLALGVYFEKFRNKKQKLSSSQKQIENILKKGAKKASTVAKKNMKEVRKMIGIG